MHLGSTLLGGTGFPAKCHAWQQFFPLVMLSYGNKTRKTAIFSAEDRPNDIFGDLPLRGGSSVGQGLIGQWRHNSRRSDDGRGTICRYSRTAILARGAPRTRRANSGARLWGRDGYLEAFLYGDFNHGIASQIEV